MRKSDVKNESTGVPRSTIQHNSDESNQSEVPYNPFAHRVVQKPTSDFGALAHLLKTSLGSGILAMPMAFKNAGLLLGSIGTIVLGIICTHCVQMLVNSSQIMCVRTRKPTLGFAKTAESAFLFGPEKVRKYGKCIGIVISVELIGSFVMGDTVYLIFISESVKQVAEFYSEKKLDIRLYILMFWIPLTLMCMFRNLKSLVPFSVLANILVLGSFTIVLYYMFREIKSTKEANLVAPFAKLPLFLATVIFAIEGIGAVLSIENEMEHPEHFLGGRCGILYIAMSIVIVIYGVIGFFGYLQYGEKTEGSITLNLPVGDVMAQVVKILIALAIFFTYALQFYVPINLIWDMLCHKIPEKYHLLSNTLLRVILVAFTVIISIAIPNLDPFISLVGAICFSTLGLFFPPVIDLVVRWPQLGRFKWRLYKNIFIIILSLISLLAGSYMSMLGIIKEYIKHK